MYTTGNDFLKHYEWESGTTQRVLEALTDDALSHAKAEGHTTLGDIAWHIATSPAYMVNQTGFDMPPLTEWKTPEGMTAAKIAETYKDLCAKVKEQAATKTAEDMATGYRAWEMDWTAATMLGAMISHEIHHRGQISVLMRQAGLVVPGIYGPNHEATLEKMKQMQEGQGG